VLSALEQSTNEIGMRLGRGRPIAGAHLIAFSQPADSVFADRPICQFRGLSLSSISDTSPRAGLQEQARVPAVCRDASVVGPRRLGETADGFGA